MRVVVIGGTGQIGSKVVSKLRELGHEAIAAAPDTGVDIISGKGLDDVIQGAEVVVDVTNKIAMDREASVGFFETAARNIMAAEIVAGVRHHIALSVLRSDRLTDSGYIAGKVAQEAHILQGPIPFTLVRAAQFFELVPMIIEMGAVDGVARLANVRFQPVAAEDVAETLVECVLANPVNGAYEIAGPEVFHIDELAERYVRETGGTTKIEADPNGTYFGAPLAEDTLLPGPDVHIQPITFEDWLTSRRMPAAA